MISADHRNIVQNFHVLIPMFGVLFMIFAVFAFNKNGDYYHVTIVQYTRVFFSLRYSRSFSWFRSLSRFYLSLKRFGLLVVYAYVHFDRFNQINNNPMHPFKNVMGWTQHVFSFSIFFFGSYKNGEFLSLVWNSHGHIWLCAIPFICEHFYERLWSFLLLANKTK